MKLVYLESIGFYFCEKTGLFYSDLYEGKQELSMHEFSIKRFIKDGKWLSKEFVELFNGRMSLDDYTTVVDCFVRLTSRG
jgi:hypothetical protein